MRWNNFIGLLFEKDNNDDNYNIHKVKLLHYHKTIGNCSNTSHSKYFVLNKCVNLNDYKYKFE